VDPGIVGDIAGDASIDATAVSDLAALTSNLHPPQIPPLPVGLTITPGGPDPTLSLGEPQDDKVTGRQGDKVTPGQVDGSLSPDHLVTLSPGQLVTVPVLLDNPRPDGSTGMTEAILALTYDPHVLTVSSVDITLGSIPGTGSGWHLVSVIDQATGQIGIDVYSTDAVTISQAGRLVNIVFHAVPGASSMATMVHLVSSVIANDQRFATQVDDAQGQFVLSPGLDQVLLETTAITRGRRSTRSLRGGI
jgi:hypothetical protein